MVEAEIDKRVGRPPGGVAEVGKDFADMLEADAPLPVASEGPVDPEIGDLLRHVDRLIADIGDGNSADILGEVVVLGVKQSEVDIDAPAGGGEPGERGLRAEGGLLADLSRDRRLARHRRDQVVLDDAVAGQGPLDGAAEGEALGADLDLAAGREFEAGQRLRERDQAVHRIRRGGVLRVERGVRRRLVEQREAVAEGAERALEGRPAAQIFPVETRRVEAHPGEERQPVGQEQPILGEDRSLVRARGVGRARPPFRREEAGIVAVQGHARRRLGEGEVGGVAEADMVHVEAGRERVGQPEKGAAERCVEPIPDLFLAVADFEIVGAIDEARCRVEAVLLDVAPMPAALKAVGGVAHRHVGRRGPLRAELRPVIGPGDLRIADVVVGEADGVGHTPVYQRRAPVAGGFLVAEIVAEREGEIRIRLERQCARDREIAEVTLWRDPAVGTVAADIEAIGQGFADRPGRIDRHAGDAVLAEPEAGDVERREQRLLRDDVDDTADGSVPVENGGRPAQHLDPLHVPRIEREGDGVGADIEPGSVEQSLDRVLPGKAASAEEAESVARRAEGRDARTVLRHGLQHAGLTAQADGLARNDVETRGRFQRRESEPARRARRRAQVEADRRGLRQTRRPQGCGGVRADGVGRRIGGQADPGAALHRDLIEMRQECLGPNRTGRREGQGGDGGQEGPAAEAAVKGGHDGHDASAATVARHRDRGRSTAGHGPSAFRHLLGHPARHGSRVTTADGRSPGSRVVALHRLPRRGMPSDVVMEGSPLTVAGAAAGSSSKALHRVPF